MKFHDRENAERMAHGLSELSRGICRDNGCTEEDHNCESIAYCTVYLDDVENRIVDLDIHDVCLSDFWRGWYESERTDSALHRYESIIYLPFGGDAQELADRIDSNIEVS